MKHASGLQYDVVYVKIGCPAFCLALYLTGVHFRDELRHELSDNQSEFEIYLVPDCRTTYIISIDIRF